MESEEFCMLTRSNSLVPAALSTVWVICCHAASCCGEAWYLHSGVAGIVLGLRLSFLVVSSGLESDQLRSHEAE